MGHFKPPVYFRYQSYWQHRFGSSPTLLIFIAIIVGTYYNLASILDHLRTPRSISTPDYEPHLETIRKGLQQCTDNQTPPVQYTFPVVESRINPRWDESYGQNETLLLKNATLFDGDMFLEGTVDILVEKGVIKSVTPTSGLMGESRSLKIIQLNGKFVTPGLVDMHSHHLIKAWPSTVAGSTDDNEMNLETGPLTPYLRALDSLKPYDIATAIIASGGVTTSLILPGSSNIMAGEAVLVKNAVRSGKSREEIVEEMLLEYRVPKVNRRRYMKMACGENPKDSYKHTRMGNAYLFRKHMTRARELLEKQEKWCMAASAAYGAKDPNEVARVAADKPSDIDLLELESTIAILNGKVDVHVHCYETEDMEDMLLHGKEFGFQIRAFHHGLDAWKIPNFLKGNAENTTIATFSEFGLYKKEAYQTNLWAGKILSDHGIPVAYKSDHGMQELNAKYLLFQAATAHSFQLPESLALQSVTSVPARSLQIDHRVGYCQPGYDADIVVWDSHPLSVGATPLQVFIDGKATLEPELVQRSLAKSILHHNSDSTLLKVPMRKSISAEEKEHLCSRLERPNQTIVVTGIKMSYLKDGGAKYLATDNLTMVIDNGEITCLDTSQQCSLTESNSTHEIVHLSEGYVLPGLTTFSVGLGMSEIAFDGDSGDGTVPSDADPLDAYNLIYAKYGVHLEGRAFDRARIGGTTRAITPPLTNFMSEGFLGGVSVGVITSGRKSIIDGGIFKSEVALHLLVGQSVKETKSIATISSAIAILRRILDENTREGNLFGKVVNGSLPLVVHVENKYDIMQLIAMKLDYPTINLVLTGAADAPAVAADLARANIPIILTTNRGAPDSWEKKDVLVGPPLTLSPAQILSDAGVKFGLALAGFAGDSHLHNLPIEAGWAAKYAGLSGYDAVNLVSRNIEEIMDLEVDEDTRSFVIWEGNPLEFGASVVLGVERGPGGGIFDCWPQST